VAPCWARLLRPADARALLDLNGLPGRSATSDTSGFRSPAALAARSWRRHHAQALCSFRRLPYAQRSCRSPFVSLHGLPDTPVALLVSARPGQRAAPKCRVVAFHCTAKRHTEWKDPGCPSRGRRRMALQVAQNCGLRGSNQVMVPSPDQPHYSALRPIGSAAGGRQSCFRY
jgi:hypothetical protein